MDYTKIYTSLIDRGLNRLKNGQTYYEEHHIVPRCMGGSDDKLNLVYLTPEEHYIAHQLLVKIYPKDHKLLSAAMFMTAKRSNNKIYGWLRRKWSDKMKSHNPMVLYPEKNARMGKRTSESFTQEERNLLSKRMKENNPMSGVKPWRHSRATEITKYMWKNADKYYEWWLNSGLEHGQNAMARHFNETYKMTHSNLVKYFRDGWVPEKDQEWMEFVCKI